MIPSQLAPLNPMWFVTLASIIGTIANLKHKRWCFIVWGITNAIWVVYDYNLGAYPQVALMLVYLLLAIWGWMEWGNRDTFPLRSKKK